MLDKTKLEDIIKFNQTLNCYEYIIPNNGNPIVEIKKEDFYNYYKMLTPQEFYKYKGGVCWDYVCYESHYFEKYFPDIDYKAFYCLSIDVDKDTITHTFIIFKYDNKYYWFESSWKIKRGVYEFKSENEALNHIIYNLYKFSESKIEKDYLLQYNALDNNLYGMTCKEYMDYMNEKINNNNLFDTPKNVIPNKTFNNKLPYVPVDLNKYKKVFIDEKAISLYKNKIKPLKHIRANINTKGYLFLSSDDEFVGLINTEKKNDGIWIQALEVNSNTQNSGIGTQLLKIATDELNAIRLSVRKNNTKAVSLYKNNNWEEYAQTKNMILMKNNKLSNKELNDLQNDDFWSL